MTDGTTTLSGSAEPLLAEAAWDAAEADTGHAEKATAWRAMLTHTDPEFSAP